MAFLRRRWILTAWIVSRTITAFVLRRYKPTRTLQASTDATLTVPRFHDGEVEAGPYPSPLHSIHVQTILSDEEAAECLRLAKEYAAQSGSWDAPDTERHATYSTCDFAVEECTTLSDYLQEIHFDGRIFGALSERYRVDEADLTYLDFFCANYQTRSSFSPNTMDRLEPHRDGSLLSFTVLLTPPDQFTGSGTVFDALRDVDPSASLYLFTGGVVRPPRAGDAVLHSGKLLHGADIVTAGSRTVLVGFVDVPFWWWRPSVLSSACRDWGRMDVAAKRYERQVAKTADGSRGWWMNHGRWLASAPSAMTGYCPAFAPVVQRADPGYQRRKKLEAEDVFLRSVLQSPTETTDIPIELMGGDITVL